MIDEIKPITTIFGLPYFTIISIFAGILLLTAGIASCLMFGSRRLFLLGIIPVAMGVMMGWFPIPFLIIAGFVAVTVSLIEFPKHISYKERIEGIEVDLYLEQLRKREK